jgi:hypothetical protein
MIANRLPPMLQKRYLGIAGIGVVDVAVAGPYRQIHRWAHVAGTRRAYAHRAGSQQAGAHVAGSRQTHAEWQP